MNTFIVNSKNMALLYIINVMREDIFKTRLKIKIDIEYKFLNINAAVLCIFKLYIYGYYITRLFLLLRYIVEYMHLLERVS